MSRRHAAPLHVSPSGMDRLPPNHALFKLELAQSMPIALPSASWSTLVNSPSRASSALNGTSAAKPMNMLVGACSRTLQKYSSAGILPAGTGALALYAKGPVGTTASQVLPAPSAAPFFLSHGNRNRLPAW